MSPDLIQNPGSLDAFRRLHDPRPVARFERSLTGDGCRSFPSFLPDSHDPSAGHISVVSGQAYPMNEAVMTFDAAGRIITVNPAFCRLTGYKAAELINRGPPYPFWPEASPGPTPAFVRAAKGAQPLMFSRKDGTRLPIELVASSNPLRHQPGMAVIRTPVSSPGAAERLVLTLDAAGMGTWEWTIATGSVICSSGVEAMHGASAGSLNGTFEQFLSRLHQEDRARVSAQLEKAIKSGSDPRLEYRLRLADGAIKWVDARGKLFTDAAGNPVRLLCLCVDITDQKRAEEERNQVLAREQALRAEMERSGRAKDEFLAVLSHELRMPLTPVLTAVQMMERDPTLGDDHLPMVEMIRRNVEFQARLVDDLLDLARICRGKLELFFTQVDVHDKIQHAVAMFDDEIAAKKLSLGLELNAIDYHVRGDAARIQQVIWNLLRNAVKFTESGGLVGLRTRNAAPGWIEIDVWDTGCGIPPEMQAKIFEAFVQGGPNVTRRYGGLGLGLSISRALVGMHGGELKAASEGVGKGSTFTVRLPVSGGADVASRDEGTAEGPGIGAGRRILLVEDHGDTRRIMKRLLERGGYAVETADGVSDALKVAAEEAFDLIICDIGLPDGNGLDLMRQLRARSSQIKGIAISGYGMEEDVRRSMDAGFIEHLTKPVDLRRLERAVRESFT